MGSVTDQPLTLPGTIGNLLRRGSPVLIEGGHTGVVRVVGPTSSYVADDRGGMYSGDWLNSALALDLRGPTGRVHAAWWYLERGANVGEGVVTLTTRALHGYGMRDVEIVALRDLCMNLAI